MVTETSIAAFLKSYYSDQKIQRLSVGNSPLVGKLLPGMKKDGAGKNYVQPVVTDTPQAQASSFAVAQAGLAETSAGLVRAFTYTWSTHYVDQSIDGKTLAETSSDRGSFENALTYVNGAGFEACGEALAEQVYGDGTAIIGTISTVVGNDVTLVTTTDSIHFHYGQRLTVTTSGHNGVVAAINRKQGIVTLAAGHTFDGTDNGRTVYRTGMTAVASGGVLGGLGYLCPVSDVAAATTIYGLDRSVDVERLGGVRSDQSAAADHEEALIAAGYEHQSAGGKINNIFLNPFNFGRLTSIIGAKQTIQAERTKMAGFGFSGIMLQLPNGQAEIYSDPWCPKGTGWGLHTDYLRLIGLNGGMPRYLNHGVGRGEAGFIQPALDGLEFRMGWYGQLVTSAPLHMLRITLPAT